MNLTTINNCKPAAINTDKCIANEVEEEKIAQEYRDFENNLTKKSKHLIIKANDFHSSYPLISTTNNNFSPAYSFYNPSQHYLQTDNCSINNKLTTLQSFDVNLSYCGNTHVNKCLSGA